jgi:hypothetical protein
VGSFRPVRIFLMGSSKAQQKTWAELTKSQPRHSTVTNPKLLPCRKQAKDLLVVR